MQVSKLLLAVSMITLSALAGGVAAATCQPGYFLAYRYPSLSSDQDTYCQECECGGQLCRDFTGCSSCPFDEFKLLKDKSYPTRSFNRCIKCNNCLFSSSCVDQIGCTSCKSSYSSYTRTFPGTSSSYNDCQYTGGSTEVVATTSLVAFFLCILPIIVVVLIVVCIVKCIKGNRVGYAGNGGYQNSSISIAHPVLSTPIYTQPAPIYS